MRAWPNPRLKPTSAMWPASFIHASRSEPKLTPHQDRRPPGTRADAGGPLDKLVADDLPDRLTLLLRCSTRAGRRSLGRSTARKARERAVLRLDSTEERIGELTADELSPTVQIRVTNTTSLSGNSCRPGQFPK
jgi:hypothetical protein